MGHDPCADRLASVQDIAKACASEGIYVDVAETTFQSCDGVAIRGWVSQQRSLSRGTLFFLHGYGASSRERRDIICYHKIAARNQLALVSFDFRSHGSSAPKSLSLGMAEFWDLQAAFDNADAQKLPRPFLAIGDSLGAMVANLAAQEDQRLAGAILLHPPANPSTAIIKKFQSVILNICPALERHLWAKKFLGRVAQIIAFASVVYLNIRYACTIYPIGERSDLLKRSLGTKAMMLYIMGDLDLYDWNLTKKVYDRWFANNPTADGGFFDSKIHSPQDIINGFDRPEAQKWFILVRNVEHPTYPTGNQKCVWDWPFFDAIIDAFIRKCLRRSVGGMLASGESNVLSSRH
jgi:pimeloyl-ACP methyl ester carboxylesterase